VPYSTINARTENVAKSPAFRSAFKYRRCLIPADGFQVWKNIPGKRGKQPYYIHIADGFPFAFAGLWEPWVRDGIVLESCTIMTTGANELMTRIHNRMPVILESKDYATWMAPANYNPSTLLSLSPPT
jgi:putative SOS response-associated peptidase YedK